MSFDNEKKVLSMRSTLFIINQNTLIIENIDLDFKNLANMKEIFSLKNNSKLLLLVR